MSFIWRYIEILFCARFVNFWQHSNYHLLDSYKEIYFICWLLMCLDFRGKRIRLVICWYKADVFWDFITHSPTPVSRISFLLQELVSLLCFIILLVFYFWSIIKEHSEILLDVQKFQLDRVGSRMERGDVTFFLSFHRQNFNEWYYWYNW